MIFEGIKVISDGLLACGVTSWLPTTLTDSTENLDAVPETIGQHAGEETGLKFKVSFEGHSLQKIQRRSKS